MYYSFPALSLPFVGNKASCSSAMQLNHVVRYFYLYSNQRFKVQFTCQTHSDHSGPSDSPAGPVDALPHP